MRKMFASLGAATLLTFAGATSVSAVDPTATATPQGTGTGTTTTAADRRDDGFPIGLLGLLGLAGLAGLAKRDRPDAQVVQRSDTAGR